MPFFNLMIYHHRCSPKKVLTLMGKNLFKIVQIVEKWWKSTQKQIYSQNMVNFFFKIDRVNF